MPKEERDNFTLSGIKSLKEDVTFRALFSVIRGNLDNLRDMLEKPDSPVEATNFLRGQIHELRYILELPDILEEDLIADQKEEKRNDKEKGANNG